MISAGRLVYIAKRRLALGFLHGYAERCVEPRILKWRANPAWPLAEMPVHLLTSRHDWKMALWMLASFHNATSHRWKVVIHEDGSLGEHEISIIKSVCPGARIWRKDEADRIMSSRLKGFTNCQAYRLNMPHAIKAFDIPQLTEASRFLLFDPDLLFFKRPDEIMSWMERTADHSCWFNQDFQEPSPIKDAQVMEDYGFQLWKRVNSGLCLLTTRTVADLASMDYWLQNPLLRQPDVQWRIEQTLLALCASRANSGGLLPLRYEVSTTRHRNPLCVSRHYVGCVRDHFKREGLIALREIAGHRSYSNS